MNRRTFLRTTVIGTSLSVAANSYANERTAVEVTRFPVARRDANTAEPPLRFAFMSDFHRSHTTSHDDIAAAVALCNAAQPHVVLLGGDYISDDATLAADCADALRGLTASHGIYFVLGNHDYWHGPETVRKALRGAGFHDITNRNTRIADSVYLCGVDDTWTGKPDVEAAFRGTGSATRVTLSHNPQIFPQVRAHACVTICGHTHGGQINIPFVPNPCLRGWKTYIQGWFHEEGSSMYVNRGIGTLSLPLRFRCRPEITVLEV